MRIHYLTHVPFEKLGAMEGWFQRHCDSITSTRFYHGDPLPAVADLEVLVVMGGPMSVNDDARYPWMAEEKRFIRQCIDADKKVLGICLGAQLIASVLGASVAPGANKEVGWFPVRSTDTGERDPIGALFADAPAVMHWHGDSFSIPDGADHLVQSEGCANQAFRYGDNVLGLQFHLEMTADNVATLCEECADDLAPGPYIEAPASMLADASLFERSHALMDQLLTTFLKR